VPYGINDLNVTVDEGRARLVWVFHTRPLPSARDASTAGRCSAPDPSSQIARDVGALAGSLVAGVKGIRRTFSVDCATNDFSDTMLWACVARLGALA
jgi:hypothetical protein